MAQIKTGTVGRHIAAHYGSIDQFSTLKCALVEDVAIRGGNYIKMRSIRPNIMASEPTVFVLVKRR